MGGPALGDWIAGLSATPLQGHAHLAPWEVTTAANGIVAALLAPLGAAYSVAEGIALHESATVEPGAVIKGPAIIGPACFIAAGAYLRGGVWLGEGVIIGPGAELKTAFVFAGTKLAHLNFVGDSVLGAGVNLEAGSVIANYRNELADKRIRIAHDGELVDTGVEKFGALLGDGCRIGANAVIAPGSLLAPGTLVPRLGLVDQGPATQ